MNNALFYESELEEVLLEHSEKQYGIDDRGKLLHYLLRRCFIVGLDKTKMPRFKKEEHSSIFMNFWLNDLAVPIYDRTFIYKEITFTTSTLYGSPLQNIYEDLMYQLSNYQLLCSKDPNRINEWDEAKKEVNEWLKAAKRKGSKYSKKEVYPYFLKATLLQRLNETYQATVQLPTKISNFHYQDLTFKLSEEEICSRHLTAFQEQVKDGELLAEVELERYVKEHLEDIEPGLKMVQSQVILPNGRIDILARDQHDQYVVIELKVEKDTDVVWQKWYYCQEIKKRYSQNTVRFIVILPQFYPEIIEPLMEDDTPTQILQFRPVIQRGKLKKADFTLYHVS